MKGCSKTGGIAGKLDGNAYNCVNYATVQGKDGALGWKIGIVFLQFIVEQPLLTINALGLCRQG